ncbi:MAG: ATP-binding protein [Deltaproteobacteria bacterium]
MKQFLSQNERKTNRILLNSCWGITAIGYPLMYLLLFYEEANFSQFTYIIGAVISFTINIILEICYSSFYKKDKNTFIIKYLIIASLTFTLNLILILSNTAMAPEALITNIMLSMLYYELPIIYFALLLNSSIFLFLILINKIIITESFNNYIYFVIFLFLFYILTGYLKKLTNILSALKKHESELLEKNTELQAAYDNLETEQQKVAKLNNELQKNNKTLQDAYNEISIKQQEVLTLNQNLLETNARNLKAYAELNTQQEEMSALNQELIATNETLQSAFNELSIKQQEVVALNQGLLDSNSKLEKAYADLNSQQEEMSALNQELIATNETVHNAFNELNIKQQEVIALNQVLTESNKNLENAYAELRQTETQLVYQEKMASLGQLSAGLAHEINTPMGAISCNVDISKVLIGKIKSSIPDDFPDAQNMLLKLDELNDINIMASKRIVNIVKSLKSFARLDDEDWITYTDISKDIDNSLILLNSRINDKIEIVKNYAVIPNVNCFGSQMNQVIMNLLVNALDAINGSGKIEISTFTEERFVCIRIIDNGIGIKPENLNKIFSPGFTTKGVGVGTGLGLAITYNIIQKHKGTIEVKSEYGKGSAFTVKIPLEIK